MNIVEDLQQRWTELNILLAKIKEVKVVFTYLEVLWGSLEDLPRWHHLSVLLVDEETHWDDVFTRRGCRRAEELPQVVLKVVRELQQHDTFDGKPEGKQERRILGFSSDVWKHILGDPKNTLFAKNRMGKMKVTREAGKSFFLTIIHASFKYSLASLWNNGHNKRH